MTLIPWFIFVSIAGACVGSFLNVVIYRLPEGRSVIHPPSHDPKTGRRLAWFENIPIVSWLVLRGRARFTGDPISVQYPLVEAVTAALFGGLFIAYYLTPLRPDFYHAGLEATWPVFVVHLVLLASLVAATVIDFRLYIIPLQLPWLVTTVALLLLPVAAWRGWVPPNVEVMPRTGYAATWAGLGATVGLAFSLALLQAAVLPRSFNDLEDHLTDDAPSDEPEDPHAFLAHPHPRREVMKELLFLSLPIMGAVLAVVWGPSVLGRPAPGVEALGGVLCGYFVGAALVWGIRILGTLAFGKEAMGLGDVHLVAAIGAVVGPVDVIFVFFTAPFLGLLGAVVTAGLASILKGRTRIIPYGPYLAAAALVVMLLRDVYHDYFAPLIDVLRGIL